MAEQPATTTAAATAMGTDIAIDPMDEFWALNEASDLRRRMSQLGVLDPSATPTRIDTNMASISEDSTTSSSSPPVLSPVTSDTTDTTTEPWPSGLSAFEFNHTGLGSPPMSPPLADIRSSRKHPQPQGHDDRRQSVEDIVENSPMQTGSSQHYGGKDGSLATIFNFASHQGQTWGLGFIIQKPGGLGLGGGHPMIANSDTSSNSSTHSSEEGDNEATTGGILGDVTTPTAERPGTDFPLPRSNSSPSLSAKLPAFSMKSAGLATPPASPPAATIPGHPQSRSDLDNFIRHVRREFERSLRREVMSRSKSIKASTEQALSMEHDREVASLLRKLQIQEQRHRQVIADNNDENANKFLMLARDVVTVRSEYEHRLATERGEHGTQVAFLYETIKGLTVGHHTEIENMQKECDTRVNEIQQSLEEERKRREDAEQKISETAAAKKSAEEKTQKTVREKRKLEDEIISLKVNVEKLEASLTAETNRTAEANKTIETLQKQLHAVATREAEIIRLEEASKKKAEAADRSMKQAAERWSKLRKQENAEASLEKLKKTNEERKLALDQRQSSLDRLQTEIATREVAVLSRESDVKKREERVAAMAVKRAELLALEKCLNERQKQLEEERESLDNRGRETEGKETYLKHREMNIAGRETELNKRESEATDRLAVAAEREKSVFDREMGVKAKESKAAEKEASVKTREEQISEREAAVESREKETSEKLASTEEKEKQLIERETSLNEKESAHSEKETSLAQMEKALIDRENAVSGKEAGMKTTADELAKREADISQKETDIKEKEQSLSAKESELQKQAEELASREAEVKDRQAAADEKQREIDEEKQKLQSIKDELSSREFTAASTQTEPELSIRTGSISISRPLSEYKRTSTNASVGTLNSASSGASGEPKSPSHKSSSSFDHSHYHHHEDHGDGTSYCVQCGKYHNKLPSLFDSADLKPEKVRARRPKTPLTPSPSAPEFTHLPMMMRKEGAGHMRSESKDSDKEKHHGFFGSLKRKAKPRTISDGGMERTSSLRKSSSNNEKEKEKEKEASRPVSGAGLLKVPDKS